jgi:hypothetical protein
VALRVVALDRGPSDDKGERRVSGLERAEVDRPRFARRGDFIWTVSIPQGPSRTDSYRINARTAAVVSSGNGRPRSYADKLAQKSGGY